MENVEIRKTGLLIQEWFNLTPAKESPGEKRTQERVLDQTKTKQEKTAARSEQPNSDAVAVNVPLTFELKDYLFSLSMLEKGILEHLPG